MSFSALQRAEIAEIFELQCRNQYADSFSALQRAEIAEMRAELFVSDYSGQCFGALQRAEIAEIDTSNATLQPRASFQCSSTSRNC